MAVRTYTLKKRGGGTLLNKMNLKEGKTRLERESKKNRMVQKKLKKNSGAA